jgi:hypothetical protein
MRRGLPDDITRLNGKKEKKHAVALAAWSIFASIRGTG